MKQEYKVGSLNTCIGELQRQTYAQRLDLEDAHHEMGELNRAQELRVDEFIAQKLKESHDAILWRISRERIE